MSEKIQDVIAEGVLLKCAEYGVNQGVARQVCKTAEARILPVIAANREKQANDFNIADFPGARRLAGGADNGVLGTLWQNMKDNPGAYGGAAAGALGGGYLGGQGDGGAMGTLGGALAGGVGGGALGMGADAISPEVLAQIQKMMATKTAPVVASRRR